MEGALNVHPSQGWAARLELGYARRGPDTVPIHRRHEGPLRVQRHFSPEPGLCEHIIVHPPAGIAGGDRLDLSVTLDAGSAVRLTTPGATKWYRSLGPEAHQHVHARLGPEAQLEWLPQAQILFSGARATTSLTFDLAPTARLLAWDLTVLGRQAGDFPFVDGTLDSHFQVLEDGLPRYADHLRLAAGDRFTRAPLGLSGLSVFGTLCLAGPALPDAALSAARAIPAPRGLQVAATQLPRALLVRLLGPSSEQTMAHLRALWHTLRPFHLGGAARPPRIWST
jgi:urease accessory protein